MRSKTGRALLELARPNPNHTIQSQFHNRSKRLLREIQTAQLREVPNGQFLCLCKRFWIERECLQVQIFNSKREREEYWRALLLLHSQRQMGKWSGSLNWEHLYQTASIVSTIQSEAFALTEAVFSNHESLQCRA